LETSKKKNSLILKISKLASSKSNELIHKMPKQQMIDFYSPKKQFSNGKKQSSSFRNRPRSLTKHPNSSSKLFQTSGMASRNLEISQNNTNSLLDSKNISFLRATLNSSNYSKSISIKSRAKSPYFKSKRLPLVYYTPRTNSKKNKVKS
jgi:hypothetical protein